MKSDSHETWKCADPELERQIRCFPYGELSDVRRLQQVEKKAVGRQRNLGLGKLITHPPAKFSYFSYCIYRSPIKLITVFIHVHWHIFFTIKTKRYVPWYLTQGKYPPFVDGLWFMGFNASFNNISVISLQSVLLVKATKENNRPIASHGQTLSHNVVSSARRHEWGSNSQL